MKLEVELGFITNDDGIVQRSKVLLDTNDDECYVRVGNTQGPHSMDAYVKIVVPEGQ